MLRSAWIAQELLSTFEKTRLLGEVALVPSRSAIGGTFIVRVNGTVVWDRRDPQTPGFPEAKEIKQRVRDIMEPAMALGHSDKKTTVVEVQDS